ncbi:glycerophosphoryl diester phosphodiesterase [Inhella inkyongensis]|uniref:Glycerophosphoryl diester phosphodiesterase n=1 Tax=Inhella inkyongensis TaxID=392593 RepID=A0A840S7D7_9BURK|nr:glycerophosphodiester phosphodiesterase [Inhella inkyongensis]MBB5204370.1 glycerophosphoryl diester phosphodiesterase [Inhella inkyongensis]
MAWPYPFWIAHRGAGKEAPENTLAAFHVGHAAGFMGFECDVQLSADGRPFLLHDDELDRTTNGSGLACTQEWAVLQGLDAGSWHSAPFVGEPLASLAGLAAWAQALGLALNLELKPSPGEAERVGDGVARWLRQHWQASVPPLLSSFDPEALRAAYAADADWPLALLLTQWRPDAPELALQLHAKAVVCQYRSLDGAGIQALHGAGLRALCYTVNEATEAKRLIDAGIDGLITDRMDLPKLVARPPRPSALG